MNTKETSADKTKYRLAEAAKKCMAASGTDAMTVTQIVQTCGVTRQTFYRNFQDKYDLILDFYTQLIRRKTGRQPEENILFPLRLYCRGSIDMTVEWIFAPKEKTPEQMAALLVSAFPAPVTDLFQQLGVLR